MTTIKRDSEIDRETSFSFNSWPSNSRWFKFGISLVDQAVISGVRFITSVMIARCAGNAELGIYSIAFGFLLIATCIQDTLVCAPFTLFHSREKGASGRIYQGSVLIQVASLGLVSSLSFGIAWGVGFWLGSTSGLTAVLGILAITTPLVLLREFARRVELARLRVTTAFCIDAASSSLQLLFLALLIQLDLLHVVGVYLATGASCAIPAFVWLTIAYRGNKYDQSSIAHSMQRHWAVGKWPFFAQLIGIVHVQVVIWIVGWKLGAATAGLFAACNYVLYLANPLSIGVCNFLSPLAVHTFLQSGVSRVRALIGFAMVSMGTVIGLFSLVAYWYSDPILTTIYKDPAFQGQAVLVLLLGVNMTLDVAHMMNDQGVWAIEHPDWLLRSALIKVMVTVILALPFVAMWGLNGAAFSLICGRLVSLAYQSSKFFFFPISTQKESLLDNAQRPILSDSVTPSD